MYKIYYETILYSINSFVGYNYSMLYSLVSTVPNQNNFLTSPICLSYRKIKVLECCNIIKEI